MTELCPWPPRDLRKLETDLDDLATAVEARSKERSDEEQIWLTRFLVVRACGYLEQVLHRCMFEHIQQKSYATVRSYSLSWLVRSINPSIGNLQTSIGRLDSGLAHELDDLLAENDEELHRDISALVTKRHAIAHGANEGMGSQRALALYLSSKRVADWIILRLCPDPARGSSFSR